MLRRIVLGTVAALALMLGLVSTQASAASLTARPTAVTDGGRVVVTIKGAKPSKATLVVAGTRYPLKRKGKAWRTKVLSAEKLATVSGAKAKVRVRVKGKNKTLKTRVQAAATTPVTPGTPGTQPLFTAPGVDSSGQAAWDAIQGYFLDSTFTNCPSGWPNCFSEERYGHFANYSQTYCRLTSAPGADITNSPKPIYILGAEQKASGAWGVSYSLDYGDGQNRIYTWFVQPDGSASGRYWYNTDPNVSPPTDQMSGLVWVRGAKDCSY